MKETANEFIAKSTVRAGDKEHRRKINFNIGKYNATVPHGKAQFYDLDLAREKAKNLKWKAIGTLDKQLQDFEAAILKKGAKVIWAEDAQQAKEAIRKICEEKACRSIVKSKSMVTEEIHLNEFLEGMGIESIETDLGEYIQQLDGEPPYHIVTPAMHKSKEDVAKLFAEKLGTDPRATPEQLTLVARRILRDKYVNAEIGITGANFIVADIGAIAVTENEGNARLTAAWPKTHIVIVGIEKVIPSIIDLALFWPLLATYGTGQKITVYNSIITGPRLEKESDGPEDMIVILLDNGRTQILANEKQRETLYCIRCGACLNACPVYKNIGGHAYGTTYSGPIGSIITPHLKQMDNWKHLSYASSLCGNCTEVCAVKINLHELLLETRHESVDEGDSSYSEKMAWRLWKRGMLHRRWMNSFGGSFKGWVVNRFVKGWAKHRTPLQIPKKIFQSIVEGKIREQVIHGMIIYSNSITPRLQYIVDFIGSQVSADGIRLTTDIELFRNSRGPKINYSSANINDEELWFTPHSLLFETGIKQQFPITFEWKESKAFFKTSGDFPFDILAATFYLLSRYEEYLPHEKDEFGRYAHQNSLAFKERFIHLPVVNLWIKELAAATRSTIQSTFKFLPTYDIDEGYCYLSKSGWRTMGGYARSALQGNWKEFSERKKVLAGKIPDPYDSFDWIRNLHEEKMKDLETYIFFLVAEKTGRRDKNISPYKHSWQETARDFMSSSSFKPGIHPSWQSGDDPSLLMKELEILEQLLRVTTQVSRQHYIRFNLPVTYRQLINAGITRDFSMGYGSVNGFRASVASPFYWYDLEKEVKTDLLLYPFCFMDANSFYEQRLTPAQTAKELVHYHYVVQLVNGTLVTIWHNTFLGTHERFKGWKEIYEDFISLITETSK